MRKLITAISILWWWQMIISKTKLLASFVLFIVAGVAFMFGSNGFTTNNGSYSSIRGDNAYLKNSISMCGGGFVQRPGIDCSKGRWVKQVWEINKFYYKFNDTYFPAQFYTLLCLAFIGLLWPISFIVRKGINK